MLKLEEIQKGAALNGIEPGHVVRIVTTEPVGDNALTVYYKTANESMLPHQLLCYLLADDPGAGKTIQPNNGERK